jgi:hypothetical protein
MTKKKDLIIAILATFCLTATLFLIIPTTSQSPSGTYDSLADLNHDGTINILDAILFANHFGTSGDPTLSVNVTNPNSETIERDLNITINWDDPIHGGPHGFGYTDVFSSEGYSRMFVRAAILDISNYTYATTNLYLGGVNWYWGTANGSDLKTFTWAYPDEQLAVTYEGGSYLPVSSQNSSEFAIEGPQCSIQFAAYSWMGYGWVKIRVSVYLTDGTTSPPKVQNTYITNWPTAPLSNEQHAVLNASFVSGHGETWMQVFTTGFSRMFVSLEANVASYQGIPVATTVSLSQINWTLGDGGCEIVPSGTLNATYNGYQNFTSSQQVPAEFITRNWSCLLDFKVDSSLYSGWIYFEVDVYFRNE